MTTSDNISGLEHLRQRWAHENFGDDPVQAQARAEADSKISEDQQNAQLSEVSVSTPYPQRKSSRKATKIKPKKMTSWKDRIPSPRSLWRKSESDETGLPEVNAALPITPTKSRSDEEAATPPSPVSKEAPIRTKKDESQPPPWLTEIYTLSWLIFFAILGTLARLGVEAITQYPSAPVTSRVLWANVGGCFVMGFLIEDRRLFKQPLPRGSKHKNEDDFKPNPSSKPDPAKIKAEHLKFKKTIPLYVGLTTGFCGSFTSFSSFMRDAFLALTNALQDPSPTTPFQPSPIANSSRNGGFSFLAMLAILILHPALSLAALQVGAQFALLLSPITPAIPARILYRFLNPFMVVTSLGCWLGIGLALTISPPYPQPETVINWRSRGLTPILFAPPGCLARYYLSKYMNGIRSSFPLGTFTSNILATGILGMAWDLQHTNAIRSTNACAVLQGVIEGFCGCLSTVSTWVVELDSLGKKKAWIYGGISSTIGLVLMIVIMGSMGWTVGFAPALCG